MRRILDATTILAFVVVIAAPTVDLRVRPDSVRSPEKRELRMPAPLPAWPRTAQALIELPAAYEQHFKDSFGLRDKLLRWNSIVKVFGFGVSPASQAYFGKDGWIFYTGSYSKEDHRGAHPFTPAELERWARSLEEKRRVLEALGCKYLYVVAPDKETVYPELLPDHMRPIGPTRRVQFLAFMKEHAPQLEILDLLDVLQEAKLHDKPGDYVYTKLGTHWNGRGMQAASRAVLERMNGLVGGFHPEVIDTFARIEWPESGFDAWTERMYIDDLIAQTNIVYDIPRVRRRRLPSNSKASDGVVVFQVQDIAHPRVMYRHDSFGSHLEVTLSEQCAYLECYGGIGADIEDVEAAAPDVMLDMFVERSLNDVDPGILVPRGSQGWAARFAASDKTLVALDRGREDWGVLPVGAAQLGPTGGAEPPRLPILLKEDNDRLALPELKPVAGEIPVLHLVLESAVETEFSLFVRPRGATEFVERKFRRGRLQQGVNEVFVPMDQGTSGELQLKPGAHPGRFNLREFEIRSVPPS